MADAWSGYSAGSFSQADSRSIRKRESAQAANENAAPGPTWPAHTAGPHDREPVRVSSGEQCPACGRMIELLTAECACS